MQMLTQTRTKSLDFVLVLIASLIICLSGQISIPLWFTPVPLTLQNSTILLVGALLGARRGAAAVFLFLVQGALGLPVFSAGAAIGFLNFIGPRGGYLLGYLIAAFMVGSMTEKAKTVKGLILTLFMGNLIIYLCGAGYLANFVGFSQAYTLGIAPFLIGDLIKLCMSLKILHWANRNSRV